MARRVRGARRRALLVALFAVVVLVLGVGLPLGAAGVVRAAASRAMTAVGDVLLVKNERTDDGDDGGEDSAKGSGKGAEKSGSGKDAGKKDGGKDAGKKDGGKDAGGKDAAGRTPQEGRGRPVPGPRPDR